MIHFDRPRDLEVAFLSSWPQATDPRLAAADALGRARE
jgi:hypothetical protein